ncbi:MAG: septum site-determining protein MinD [Clostridia bacterium]|nr:septum site-determining protein MinD [Clostridia bacterium]
MSAVIAIASGKGGTGKTTTCACLSVALARAGKRVLSVDCDFGLRNLDLALGLGETAVFDAADAINGVCTPNDAVIIHNKYPSLHLICAPQDEKKADFTPAAFATLVRELEPEYDFILLDCPASLGHAFECALSAANEAILVTIPQSYALRDTQKIADVVTGRGIENARLIVNMVRTRHISRGYSKNIDDIIDMVALPLLGVVPYDENISAYQNRRMDIMDDERLSSTTAFYNIARRIMGERVPIMKIKNRRLR